MAIIGSYRELVQQAYDSLKTDPPDEEIEERPPLTPEYVQYLQSEAERIRTTLGETVEEILAKRKTTDPFKVLDALFFCSCLPFLHDMPTNETESMIIGCYWLPAEVSNGGFHQYFHNSAGDLWPFVLKAMDEGHDDEGVKRFLDLISIFPDGYPSIHRRMRWAQMQEIEVANEKKVEAHFDRHTKEFHAKEYPESELYWSLIERRASDIRLPWHQPFALGRAAHADRID